MTQPTPAEQLLNLADRAERGPLTGDEAARLRDGINALHIRIWNAENARDAWAAKVGEAERKAAAMTAAMESTAADALKHRGCHMQLMAQCTRAERAEAAIERVRAELDRIAALPTVTTNDGQANTFAVGARWTLRMLRENALDEHQEQQL